VMLLPRRPTAPFRIQLPRRSPGKRMSPPKPAFRDPSASSGLDRAVAANDTPLTRVPPRAAAQSAGAAAPTPEDAAAEKRRKEDEDLDALLLA
jgi:hypothetical protein